MTLAGLRRFAEGRAQIDATVQTIRNRPRPTIFAALSWKPRAKNGRAFPIPARPRYFGAISDARTWTPRDEKLKRQADEALKELGNCLGRLVGFEPTTFRTTI